MRERIRLLDCTLRDGCYIVGADFGVPVLKGILRKLVAARVDIIECGWLKDMPHKTGTAFYHVPADANPYLPEKKSPSVSFAVMMDWDRYDLKQLPVNDGNSIDIIRVVFPKDHFREAIPLGRTIKEQGYRLFYQAANTLGYSDQELVELAQEINKAAPESLSIVDTFGAMYPEDLSRIFSVLDRELSPEIALGFHSHNNQQLSFALSMEFVKLAEKSTRKIVVDASLCGMGRGAGNTTTELLVNYLNRFRHCNYDMNEIMDTIDLYLSHLGEIYEWGYSIPYFIAGIFCTHVNNISYLQKHHKTLSRDMRLIIESVSPEKRRQYDYDNLEKIYLKYQDRMVDDSAVLARLESILKEKEVLLLGPGRTLTTHQDQIRKYISKCHPVVIGVNAVPEQIACDFTFFSTPARYLYAEETRAEQLERQPAILTSNIRRTPKKEEWIVNFNLLCKLGWEFFDNACIMCLRLMEKCHAGKAVFAGFDGFPEEETSAHFYADRITQPVISLEKRIRINADISEMLQDFSESTQNRMPIAFLTPSRFQNLGTDTSKGE